MWSLPRVPTSSRFDSVATGDLGQVKYTNIMSTGRLLASEYGVMQGLFKGLSFRISLIATTFFLINNFKQAIGPVLYPDVLGA